MTIDQTVSERATLLAEIPATEQRYELAGISTPVLEGGEGPTVVLLHGPAGNACHWVRVIPDLVRTHRVIAPDLPGHGASEIVGDGELDAERVLSWLAELIERTCPTPPALVGHSAGGAIAARFAATYGEFIDRLVLVDSLGLTGFDPAPEFGAALHEYLAQPTDSTHDDLWRYCALDVETVQRDMGPRWEPFRAYNVDRANTPTVIAAVGELMEHVGIPAIEEQALGSISVPTSLIWGRHNLAVPLAVAEAAGERFGWPLRVIEECADDPPVEQPAAFLAAVRAAVASAADLSAAGFGGEVVDREHPRFDELRQVFNGMVQRRPALIARCESAEDVSVAIGFARDQGMPLSVYGGGHNVTGNAVCDDGLTVDLRPMKAIEVDPEARTARVEGGVTWGELDAATQEHGLAVTGGRMSTTGIGGLILGGGSGWLERKCGYTVDNLLGVETVTADGRILTASESENADLFWATRGGAGNFGVVTSFELRLHPIGPTVLGGMLLYPAAMAADVLRNFREVLADAPDEVGAGVALITAPDADPVPEPVRGEPVVGVVLCYAGPIDEGEEALRPLREFGPPAVDLVEPMPYVELQRMLDADFPEGERNYWTGDFLAELSDEAIEVLCRFHLSKPSPLTELLVLPKGGQIKRVPDGTMALSDREAPFDVHAVSLWRDPADDERNVAFTRGFHEAMRPFATGRVYVNFLSDEGRERAIASWGDDYARLQELKRRYDPENVFRASQNITPSANGGDPA